MTIAFALFIIAVFVWGTLALWVQLARQKALRYALISLWMLLSAFALAALFIQPLLPVQTIATLLFIGATLALLYWWRTIRPSNNRNWIPDVARQTHGSLAGNIITIENVRNFIWHSPEQFTEQWETRQYDLSQLDSVDLALSHWSSPAIAHAMVSFGFQDKQYLTFSVEIRRKVGDAFSELGGFFKMYELSIIAADERDILFVRSNIRQEDGYLYRVHMEPAAMQSLLLAYLDKANQLVHTPRFYHTITGNCTTLIFRMMDRIVPGLPLNWRLLASGYLPEYLYKVDALQGASSIAEYRLRGRYTERARAIVNPNDYSHVIREGVPGI